jgi:hypothetical protein
VNKIKKISALTTILAFALAGAVYGVKKWISYKEKDK